MIDYLRIQRVPVDTQHRFRRKVPDAGHEFPGIRTVAAQKDSQTEGRLSGVLLYGPRSEDGSAHANRSLEQPCHHQSSPHRSLSPEDPSNGRVKSSLPLLCAVIWCMLTKTPPHLSPNNVTFPGSPPKCFIFLLIQRRARTWSLNPILPGTTASPVLRKPRTGHWHLAETIHESGAVKRIIRQSQCILSHVTFPAALRGPGVSAEGLILRV